MQTTWREIIDRAKVYCDDDHAGGETWIDDDRWMNLAHAEMGELYRRWLRMSMVGAPFTDVTFGAGSLLTINNAYAIVGVAEVIDSSTPYRLLQPSQPLFGTSPYWGQVSSGKACTWSASGLSTSITIKLDPPDATGTYMVRYVSSLAQLEAINDLDTPLDLLDGWDERLVLGIAKRAHVKDSVRSAVLQDLLDQAEADITFTATGRIVGDGPRVRIKPRHRRPVRHPAFSWPDPVSWRYL